MRYIYLASFCLLLALCSCKQKCTADCRGFISIQATGYTSHELDTVLFRVFARGSSFSSPIDSFFITETKKVWWYMINDTTSDTFFLALYQPKNSYGSNLLSLIGKTNGKYNDFEVVIPSKRVYRVEKLFFGGQETQVVYCDQNCDNRQYLSSYTLDGVDLQYAPYNYEHYIHIKK